MVEALSKLTKSGHPKIAFLIDRGKLERLADILEGKVGAAHETEYTILLSDDSRLKTNSLDEVSRVDNTVSQSITTIIVSNPLTNALHFDIKFANVEDAPVTYEAVSYTHLTLPTTPYV